MLRSPLVVILLILHLTIWYVQSGSVPGHVEPSKDAEKGALSQIQSVLKDVQETNKEQQELIGSLQTDLLETRNLLAQALLKLASPEDPDMKSSDNHDITKRSDPEQSPEDLDDILSGLSLQNLLPLITARCKDGRDGINGINGKDGDDGRDGINGLNGLNGKDGRDGLPGADGLDGSQGPQGHAGVAGANGPPGLPAAAQTHSVYTRWGRTTCTSTGFAAGSYYGHTGGGVNYQCMPLRPEYNSYTASASSGRLSGVEYDSPYSDGLFSISVRNKNVPCARCLSPRSAVMMYPAMRNCPTGWSKEYEGYLMSGAYSHAHPTTFECVDSTPEYISGSSSDTDGARFYFITPDCSSTGTIGDCTYYNSGKQLTCVVCSK